MKLGRRGRARVGGALFFTSPIGLGHASRDAAIAAELGGAAAGFVSGGAAAALLSMSGLPAEDAYRAPRLDVRGGRLRGGTLLLLRYLAYYRRCLPVASRIIAARGPGVAVCDEDFAAAAAAQRAGVPAVLVTDMLETRVAGRLGGALEARMNRAMRRIMDGCRAVIVPEDGPCGGNVARVGPIARRPGAPRAEVRRRAGFRGPTVLVTVGGTAAGAFLARAMARAARELAGECDVVLAPGPEVDAPAGMRSLGFRADVHELVLAADAVVSLAGRSTIDEARAAGTPGVFIPVGGHFEQEANARAEGFGRADAGRLAELVRGALRRGRGPGAPGGAPGAGRAAGIIRGVLGGAGRPNG